MRWWIFAIVAYISLALEVSLRDVLEIGTTGVAPSFVIIYATFIALNAPSRVAIWSCLVLGLAMDLLNTTGDGTYVIVGPYALGFALACFLLLQLRTMVLHRNLTTLAFCVLVAAVFAHIVILALMTARSWIDPFAWSTGRQLLTRLGIALYSAALTLPLGVLNPLLTRLHDFPQQHARWSAKRSPALRSSARER
jgi:rod shape-determining protein MreD